MESSKNNRVEKRGHELVDEDDDSQHRLTHPKKPKLPGLARYIQFTNISSLIISCILLIRLFCFKLLFLVWIDFHLGGIVKIITRSSISWYQFPD